MSFLSKPLENFTNWMSPISRKKHIYQFKEGSLEDKEILSSKGAHICELARTLGMPIPKGFILSTEASMQFESCGGSIEHELFGEIVRAVSEMERETGKKFGVKSTVEPLLLCLRSGALVSATDQAHSSIGAPESWRVPGVMNTLLGIGFNDDVVEALCKSCDEKSALNAYAHFLMTYAMLIYGVSASRYHSVISQITHAGCSAPEHGAIAGGSASGETGTGSACPGSSYLFSVDDLRTMVVSFKKIHSVPENGYEQLKDALTKLYGSWFSDVSITYRDSLDMYRGSGIAVIVSEQIMGGSGIFSTRSPVSGDSSGPCGFYWPEASGQKIDMEAFHARFPENYKFLEEAGKMLERKFSDMQDVEFAMDGKDRLWILNSMPGHRRPSASVKIAHDMITEGLLTERLALSKIDPLMMGSSRFSRGGAVDGSCTESIAGTGVASSDGIVTGRLAFSLDNVMEIVDAGLKAILCRDDCDVNDLAAIKLSSAVVTVRGSATSPTAIFCRGLNKVCVTGISGISLRYVEGVEALLSTCGCLHVRDKVTVDGSNGTFYYGAVKWTPAAPSVNFEYIMGLSDKYRRLQVFSYAKCLSDCERAIETHADGVALLSTDWMFDGGIDRLDLVRTILFSSTDPECHQHLEELETLLCADFMRIFRLACTVDSQKPVIIQLLDNDLDDFLPETETELVDLATRLDLAVGSLKTTVISFRYQSRHSGTFGRRVYAMCPDLIRVQVRAMIKASMAVNTELEQASREARENMKATEAFLMGSFSPCSEPGVRFANGANRIVPLLSLPMTATWDEVDRLASIVKTVTEEFLVSDTDEIKDAVATEKGPTPSVQTATGSCSDVLRYGLLLGSPRACIDIEEFLTRSEHDNIAFVTFDADRITECMFGMSSEDLMSISAGVHGQHPCAPRGGGTVPKRRVDPFSPGASGHAAASPGASLPDTDRGTRSPSQRKLYGSERNPFHHLDETGVGHLLESTVRACRAVKRHGDDHLKLGVVGEVMCSDPTSIKFFNSLDINYIGCAPERTEMTCLGAAQAQIRRSATGSAPPPSLSDSAWDWYHPQPNSISSGTGSRKEPSALQPPIWTSWDAPFVRYWKQAEKESFQEKDSTHQPTTIGSSSSHT